MQTTLNDLGEKGPRHRSKSVAESWQRIATFLKNVGHEFDLSEGTASEAIERFETRIGLQLPPDFRESLTLHEGNHWWVLPNYGELLPLGEIERQWSQYKEWQESGSYANNSRDWEVRDCHGPIKPLFWSVRRVPVTDNSGDHLLLDLDPPGDGVYGQIVHHSHEVGPLCVVATSWAEFLANLVDDLEGGNYFWDHSGHLKRVHDT